MIFEKLFNLPSAVREHQTAALAQEREEFLSVLVEQYLVDVSHTPGKNQLANAEDSVALSQCCAAATQRVQS